MAIDKHDLRRSCYVRADFAAFEDLKRRRAAGNKPDHQRAMKWFDDAVMRARAVGALPAITSAADLEIKCRYAAALNRIGTDRGAGWRV